MRNEPKLLQPDEGRRLADLLGEELTHYRRLLRLAWRQNSYMKRQDVDRLAANARDWGRWIPAADRAAPGARTSGGGPEPPAGCGDPARAGGRPPGLRRRGPTRCGRRACCARSAPTAGSLARQNALNRQLARILPRSGARGSGDLQALRAAGPGGLLPRRCTAERSWTGRRPRPAGLRGTAHVRSRIRSWTPACRRCSPRRRAWPRPATTSPTRTRPATAGRRCSLPRDGPT